MVNSKTIFYFALLLLVIFSSCQRSHEAPSHKHRDLIERYRDHKVRVFGHFAAVKLPIQTGATIWNPVQVVRGPDSLMYVSSNTGEIYALVDSDGDGLEDQARLFCDVRNDSLRAPASMVFKGRDLYVGTAQEVRIYADRNSDGLAEFSETFFDDIPHSEHPYEWTSALTFGADNHLYLVLTTDSWHAGAAPDPEGWRGAMLRIAPDGSQAERYATGLRSVPAMVYQPDHGFLLVDNQGGGNSTEELIMVR